MSNTTPTQRTIRALRNEGMRCAIVEKWNAYAPRGDGGRGIRQDLFGIIDVLALKPGEGFLGVQCCAGSGYQKHLRKLLIDHNQECHDWLETPTGLLQIWAWRKVKVKRGGKAVRWEAKIKSITLDDLII